MKILNRYIAILALIAGLSACDDQLDVVNPNTQTTDAFGNSESELNEALIACYSLSRLEGTNARVGYVMDALRGDEIWNSSQQWYLAADNLNALSDYFMLEWPWRDNFCVVNRTNFILSKVETALKEGSDSYKQIKGQALFLRAQAYYNLAIYYQVCPIELDYDAYSDLNNLYSPCATQDEVWDQIEADLSEAMILLPSRDKGGQWAQGRATCGSAAGYMARALMFRHKFDKAYIVLKDIMDGKYGKYRLMDDYGDNFREGTAYENNDESLWEVQFMDYGTGGTNEVWTTGNLNSDATQGHAIESNFASQDFGSWGDIAGSNWLYNLFKEEKSTDGFLDPRLYWTLVTYEEEYDAVTGKPTAAYPSGDVRSNTVYQTKLEKDSWMYKIRSNTAQGGISIAKFTNARNNIYKSFGTGLKCGVNIRLMRYSDVLLRAAECANELGDIKTAVGYINQVRDRVKLPLLKDEDFPNSDALFEQIANVERPKEFGCEYGRGADLIRWGFFYDAGRLQQMTEHAYYVLAPQMTIPDPENPGKTKSVSYVETKELTSANATGSSFSSYSKGHEYFPIWQTHLNNNVKLGSGNSANTSTDNSTAFFQKGYKVRPVVK